MSRGLTLAAVTLVVAAGVVWWVLTREARDDTLPVPGSTERVTIEVLNGAGVDGLAASVTRVLRRRGLDVVNYGTAPFDTLQATLIVVRRSDTSIVAGIRAALGAGVTVVEPDPRLLLDASVILGKDLSVGIRP